MAASLVISSVMESPLGCDHIGARDPVRDVRQAESQALRVE